MSINSACNSMVPSQSGAELRKVLATILTDMAALTAQLNQLRTDFAGHVHGGVTAGAANTAAAATTSTAVVLASRA